MSNKFNWDSGKTPGGTGGVGDFVGPSSATPGNFVVFADGTGKVGSDGMCAPGSFAPIASVHNPVTIGAPANGLGVGGVGGQVVSLALSAHGVTGALTGADWDTFNDKQNAITAGPALLGNGSAQYQVITTGGATPFAPVYSDYYYRGTTGGTLWADVTTGKTLKLISADNYNATIPATGTVAMLNVENVFTAGQTVAPVVDTLTALVVNDQDGNNVVTVDTINNLMILGGISSLTTPVLYMGTNTPIVSGWDGPVQIVGSNITGDQFIIRNTLSNKIGSVGFINDGFVRLSFGVGGTARTPPFQRNWGQVTTSKAGTTGTAYPAGLVIGHTSNQAPIVFIDNNTEQARIERGTLSAKRFVGNAQYISPLEANQVEGFSNSDIPKRTISAFAPINPTYADIWVDIS